jgi:hypothetical protein
LDRDVLHTKVGAVIDNLVEFLGGVMFTVLREAAPETQPENTMGTAKA